MELYSEGQDRGEYFTTYRWNIVNLYHHDMGDEITVRLKANDSSFDLTNAYFYYEARENTEALFDSISRNSVNIKKVTSSEIDAEIEIINPEFDSILFTIPYDKGWNIYLDDKKVEAQRAVGILMSIDAESGKHRIVMKYTPPGRRIGIIISLAALLITALNIIYKKIQKE